MADPTLLRSAPVPDGRWWRAHGTTAFGCRICGKHHETAPRVQGSDTGWVVVWRCPACGTTREDQSGQEQVQRWSTELGPWSPAADPG